MKPWKHDFGMHTEELVCPKLGKNAQSPSWILEQNISHGHW